MSTDRGDKAGPLILEMHRIEGAPWSPMQMISADLLAYYRRCEVELVAIKAALPDQQAA